MTTAVDLLLNLQGQVEPFLVKWTLHMDRAGYLSQTTAKREDCIRSYQGFLEPLWQMLEDQRRIDSFGELLGGDQEWAGAVLAMSERHRFRGITMDMFFGCFKTMVHSIVELLQDDQAPRAAVRTAVDMLRAYADAMEVLLIAHWSAPTQEEVLSHLDETNRQLTLQKNKFENIFAITSDLVLVTNADGHVEQANEAARKLLGRQLDESIAARRPVWSLLGIGVDSMTALLRQCPPATSHEVALDGGSVFLDMRIAELSAVSLASSGYLFVLADITSHVRNRAMLEQAVRERTNELEAESRRLEEMNVTLRNVLATIESERRDYRASVAHTVETTLLPTLKYLQKADDATVRRGYAGLLSDQLLRLYEGAGSDGRLLVLTPTELKVCQFIQSGVRTKEIAESLNLSIDTVQSHRKSIRRKLRLRGKDVNLFSFLQSGQRAGSAVATRDGDTNIPNESPIAALSGR